MNLPVNLIPVKSIINKQKVSITSSARLHMGFYDLSNSTGVMYGGLGLSIDAPCTQIQISKYHKHEIIDKSHTNLAVKIDTLISNWKANFYFDAEIQKKHLVENIQVLITQAIPSHVGLGSGTQMALAIGEGLNQLFDTNLSLTQIAEFAGRGKRSGIGIGAFSQGGFLVDAGKLTDSQKNKATVPEIHSRLNFPNDWRILLINDITHIGLHGTLERQAFQQLPLINHSLKAMVLDCMLPALHSSDLQTFGTCMQELQTYNGDFFAPFQGGRFASQDVASVLAWLQQNGVLCVGQSSWGPTGFAIAENAQIAQHLLTKAQLAFSSIPNIIFNVVSAKNSGATVTLS